MVAVLESQSGPRAVLQLGLERLLQSLAVSNSKTLIVIVLRSKCSALQIRLRRTDLAQNACVAPGLSAAGMLAIDGSNDTA